MNWQEFLNDVFLGDREEIGTMQRLVGYAATGEKREGVAVLCYGTGSNGKTLFFEVLKLAFGDGLVSMAQHDLAMLFGRPGGPSPWLLPMERARLAVFGAVRGMRRADCSVFRLLSGDDSIVARDVHVRESVKFRNAATPFLVVNEIPRLLFEGHWSDSCLVCVPFPVAFVPGETSARTWKKAVRSGEILSALREDTPAILSWIEEGARLFRAEGLIIPERFRASALTAKRVA